MDRHRPVRHCCESRGECFRRSDEADDADIAGRAIQVEVASREQGASCLCRLSRGKTSPRLFPPKEGESRSLRFRAAEIGPDQNIASYRLFATRFSLAQLTDTFARQLGRVIVDETGLKGEYDFTLEIAADEGGRGPMDPAVLFNALREQLGLTLKSEKTAVDILVIDSAEKVAAGNQA